VGPEGEVDDDGSAAAAYVALAVEEQGRELLVVEVGRLEVGEAAVAAGAGPDRGGRATGEEAVQELVDAAHREQGRQVGLAREVQDEVEREGEEGRELALAAAARRGRRDGDVALARGLGRGRSRARLLCWASIRVVCGGGEGQRGGSAVALFKMQRRINAPSDRAASTCESPERERRAERRRELPLRTSCSWSSSSLLTDVST